MNELYNRRKELGLTLEQVGDACGVGKSTVRKWENGIINNMGRDKIVSLAKVLNVSPLFILNMDEEKPVSKYEKRLIAYASKLNDIGKKKLLERAEELTYIPKYQKQKEILEAAHERTDIEVTDEMRKHDDDLMRNDDLWDK